MQGTRKRVSVLEGPNPLPPSYKSRFFIAVPGLTLTPSPLRPPSTSSGQASAGLRAQDRPLPSWAADEKGVRAVPCGHEKRYTSGPLPLARGGLGWGLGGDVAIA